jgi:hypothetical protein
MEEIQGYILSSYRKARKKFMEEQARWKEQTQVAQRLKTQLDPLPGDFPEAALPQTLQEVMQKLILVGDAFEGLADDAKTERARFAEQARKGQFQAITEVPDRLFHNLTSQLHIQGGDLMKATNAVQSYRSEKIAAFNDQLPLLNPLYVATGKGPVATLQLADVEDLSLHDLGTELALREQQFSDLACSALEGTGLTVDQWREVAKSVRKGVPCHLDPVAQDQLVKRGVLKVQLAFGNAG